MASLLVVKVSGITTKSHTLLHFSGQSSSPELIWRQQDEADGDVDDSFHGRIEVDAPVQIA